MHRFTLLLLAPLAIAACGNPPDDVQPCSPHAPADACHAPSPDLRGPMAVGVTTVTLVDDSRTEPNDQPRTLRVEIWYPAVAASMLEPRDVIDMLADAPEELRDQLSIATLVGGEQNAARDAEPSFEFAPYPLLVFSHGNGGVRFQNYNLMVHLASHGYVVAAPDHTDDTLYDLLLGNFNAGTVIYSLVQRPTDVSFVASSIEALDGPLAGMASAEHYGVLGHSLGGSTSIIMGAGDSEFTDERVAAVMPMTPASTPVDAMGAGAAKSRVPMLILGAKEDQTLDYASQQLYGYEQANEPKELVSVIDAGHFSFTELCHFDLAAVAAELQMDISNVIEDGCGPQNTPADDMLLIQDHYGAAFFNRYLRNSAGAGGALGAGAVPEELRDELEILSAGIP